MKEIDVKVATEYDVQIIEEQANILYKEEDYEGALSHYEEALADSLYKTSLLVGKGNCLRKLERYDEALAFYEQVLISKPRSVSVYHGICEVYFDREDYDKAWKYCLNLFNLNLQNAISYDCRGRILLLQSEPESALGAFEQAILLSKNDDNLAGYYHNKGSAFLKLHRYDEALDAYHTALQRGLKKPTSQELRRDFPKENLVEKSCKIVEKGNSFLYHHNYEDAQRTFDLALYFDDECGLAYIGKGTGFLELKHYQKANDVFYEALKILPNDPRVYAGQGKAHLGLKQYEEALQAFERVLSLQPMYALALQPTYALALTGKGEALLNLGNYEEALEHYNKTLRRYPRLAQAHAGKGHALYALNQQNEALQVYTNAIQSGIKDAQCYSNSGEIRVTLGNYTEARKMYEQAFHFDPDLLSAHFGLGDMQAILKQDAEAAETYAKALALLQVEQPPETLWRLANPLFASSRPVDIQFTLLCQFILKAPHDIRVTQALKNIGTFYQQLFDPQSVSTEKLQANVQKLAQVLASLPADNRADALLFVTKDDIPTAQMLIMLKYSAIAGLGALAQKITMQLKPELRIDDLFTDFYLVVLDSYNVPPEDADWLYSQILIVEQHYEEAKSALTNLAKRQPKPDVLWLLAAVLEELHTDPQNLLEVLLQFTNVASSLDERMGLAWERIGLAWERVGQLYEQQQNGAEAINAYKKAKQYGHECQQWRNYRAGRWEAIAGLHTYADFAFPPVIVIDLESEYRPDAPLGSTVFEIGAVCIKGSCELDTYQAVIQRGFVSQKVVQRQDKAKPLEQVMAELHAFIKRSQPGIEQAIIVGHNLRVFDAPHLRAMGLPIGDDQIIDTLTFARLLYPDSMHHNLSLLCEHYGIPLKEAHNALPDAQACAYLLHALGDELIARGESFLAGFRAFVPVGSAFDRAVLQPRGQAASPGYVWELDPAPSPTHILTLVRDDAIHSPQILYAIEQGNDALVERFDPQGAYAGRLPNDRQTTVTVATRSRLEQLLTAAHERTDLFVLPDPRTLLCPPHLRESIEHEEDPHVKLALFCLYQASHNHDASTLYPARLPVNPLKSSGPDEEVQETQNGNGIIQKLRQILLTACCTSDRDHSERCPARRATREAEETSMLLLATHENFLRQPRQLPGDLLIVDDIDDLQMHFAEYLANQVTDQELLHQSKSVHDLMNTILSSYVAEHLDSVALHERLPLTRIKPYLKDAQGKSLLTLLREQGYRGEMVARKLEYFCQASSQPAKSGYVHAYWLDLTFSTEQTSMNRKLEHWGFYGINEDVRLAFGAMFWQPFRQRILCGTAVSLGGSNTQFLQRFFGIPEIGQVLVDKRKPAQVYIPVKDTIRPSSFLARRSWAEDAGRFLYRLACSSQQSIAVTLHSSAILGALAHAFGANWKHINRRVLSPHLGWTTAKIEKYLSGDGEPLIAFIPPRLRRVTLDDPVGIEVTGPLRFLNQQDPLVAAQMRAFLEQQNAEAKEGAFTSYLLPQALLEIKARTASQAEMHIILDSALNHVMYRDEVSHLFGHEVLHTLPELSENSLLPDAFIEALSKELDGHFTHRDINDEDLYETLHTYWNTERFRSSSLDQKAVIQSVFEGKDQLVIAATGGGKSLCFQLPAILLAQDIVPQVTLVISPLLALMQDQVESLRQRGVFSAMLWNSTLSSIERRQYVRGIKQGDYSIIYISPEQVYSTALRNALGGREIGLIAIDEAHCVSQWGHYFRTTYFKLKNWIHTHICEGHRRFPLLALTATARKGYHATNEKGTIDDIVEKLGLNLAPKDVPLSSPERPELALRVEQIAVPCPYCRHLSQDSEEVRCKKCLQRFKIEKADIRHAKVTKLLDLLSSTTEDGLCNRWDQPLGKRQRGIIYCRTRQETEDVYKDICEHIRYKGLSLRIAHYHAGLKSELATIYQRFISNGDDGIDIVVATNAFGMGIDARRLGFVIHFDVPATLEAYYQEAGRAGRDDEFNAENRAQCILFYHEHDLERQRGLTSYSSITDENIEGVYKALGQIRSSGQSEILVTKNQLQCLSGLDADRIDTVLYYLENHTQIHDKPILERQENAAKLWQLKFEQGYEERISDPNLHPLSKELANIFCLSSDFALNEERTVIIDPEELAAHLHWELPTLENEKSNLAGRHIVVSALDEYVQWNKNKAECISFVKVLVKSTVVLLNNVYNERALHDGECVEVSIQDLYDNGTLNTADLPIAIFTAFLYELQKASAGNSQLFTLFTKSTQHRIYQLRLKMPSDGSLHEAVKHIRQNLHQQFQDVIQRFGCDSITVDKKQLATNGCYIDLLKEAPDYAQRQQLSQSLNWLKGLGLLTFLEQNPSETAMRVAFLQDTVSIHAVKIDLAALRLVERYGECKLDLMREYATGSVEERQQLLHDYFFGKKPLIEPFAPLSHMTDEQKKLVMLKGGYHLIQAPAGSGKSFVLLEHIRYLVEHLLVPSDHILVTAHQHGAINRLGNQLEPLQNTSRAIQTKTLQSLGEGIFKGNLHLLMGVDGQSYFLVDKALNLLKGNWSTIENQELKIVSGALVKLYSDGNMIIHDLPAGMKGFQLSGIYQRDDKLERQCLKAISLFRSLGIFPASIFCVEDMSTTLQWMIEEEKWSWLRKNLAFYYAVYISYQLLQREHGVYTFDDQILFALAILRAHPTLVEHWQRKYEHIIVDEFQDLTSAGAELIGLLSHKHQNVLAVGDRTQRILMKFTEEVELDETFGLMSDDTFMHEHSLTTNFRSVQEILDFAQTLPHLPQIYQQKQKSACVSRGLKPTLIRVQRNVMLPLEGRGGIQAMVEAALHYIDELPQKDAGSVALLAAKSDLARNIHTYLQKKNRSFAVLKYEHHYQSYPVKRYLTYLRLIQDCSQIDAVEFLLKHCLSPYFKINQIDKLKTIAEQCNQTLLETALDPDISTKSEEGAKQLSVLQKHVEVIQRYTSDSLCKDVWPSVRPLLQTPEVQQSEEPGQAESSVSENEELEEILKELGEKTVQEALRDIEHFITCVEENKSNHKLVVGTIDSAKSQDFDTVFLIGADQLQEGRRWYVSVTRAKQRFFALIDASVSIHEHQILRNIPEKYYDILHFPSNP